MAFHKSVQKQKKKKKVDYSRPKIKEVVEDVSDDAGESDENETTRRKVSSVEDTNKTKLPVKSSTGDLLPSNLEEPDDVEDKPFEHMSLVWQKGEKRGNDSNDEQSKKRQGENDHDDDDALMRKKKKKDAVATQPKLNAAALLLCRSSKKAQIASLAESVMSDPAVGLSASEEGRSKARQLIALAADDQDKTIRKLATLSLVAVFKDILPEYHIRLPTNQEKQVKQKKEVRKLLQDERNMVETYQTFLKLLHSIVIEGLGENDTARNTRTSGLSLAIVAIRAMCTMLVARPKFNFRENLLSTIVPHMNSPVDDVRAQCCACISTLLEEDTSGDFTLESVVYVSKYIRNHGHGLKGTVHSDMLDCLLKCDLRADMKDIKRVEEIKEKKRKKKRKRRLKHRGEDDIEEKLAEAEATADPYHKHAKSLEALRELFTCYLRILKKAPSSTLMPAVLRGVARYVHLINLEIAQALVTALHGLINTNILDVDTGLQTIHTIAMTLRGPGVELRVDESELVGYLYRTMLRLTTLENRDECIPQLIKCIEAIFFGRKLYQQNRVGAVAVRAAMLANCVSPHACLALMSTTRQMLIRYSSIGRALVDVEENSLGSTTSNTLALGLPPEDESVDPAMLIQDSAVLWAISQLKFHYHPYVRKFAAETLKMAPILPPDRPLRLFDTYNPYVEGTFNPAVPKTLSAAQAGGKNKNQWRRKKKR